MFQCVLDAGSKLTVPYIDSAGIGALVGAYVTHQKGGRSLSLVGVSDRVHNALKVTHVEQFFQFYNSVDTAASWHQTGNKKGGLCGAALASDFLSQWLLDRLDILRLPALRALDHVELHLLTLLQAAEPAGLNRGEVHEDILSILAADKTITFGVVKPLYCSCFHVLLCSFCVMLR